MSFFPEFSIETWVLIATFLTLTSIYGYAPYSFFKKIGIQGPTPFPFIGTYLEYRRGAQYLDMECYQKFGKLWGLYDGRQPLLAVMDTAMIKTILVKECYTIFTNRRDVGLNGQLYDAVFLAEDNEWKRIRSVLSPSFTSGRLKEMYPIMLKHSSNLIKGLHKQVKEKKEIIEVKQVFGPYSMDVVAGTAFSVDIDSINQPSDPFVTNMKRLLSIFSFKNPLLIVIVLFPFLGPFLEKIGLSLFPADVMKFFYNSIERIKSDRKKNNHKNRVDFMQLMVDSQISENKNDTSDQKGLTDHEILSQAMIFILAGYESSSSSLCFLAYNLATNPHTQKTLQEEIDKTFPEKGQPTYDALMQMEYLDMVVKESLRLYPINNRLERVAKTSITLNGVTIPKGTTVMIPLYTLHRDPALWSEPEVFKPERFSKENKDNIDPYAFLTFGAGPRNCLGMRFAVLMMKLAIVEILQNFSLVTCKETQIPMMLANDFFTTPKTPIKVGLEPRASAADSSSG